MFRKNLHFSIPLAIIFLYYLPYIIYGEISPMQIHDNLDSNLVWIKMLMDNHALYAGPNKMIDQIFYGLPRYVLLSDYRIGLIFFKIFGMYWGLLMNMIVMSISAFFGMFLLLKHFVLKNSENLFITSAVALLFSLLPFWSFTLNVAASPFVFYAFLRIRSGDKDKSNWIILFVYAFYSSLITIGLFVLIIFTVITFIDFLKTRKISTITNSLFAISTLSIVYLINYFPLIYSFISGSGFTSHKVEMLFGGGEFVTAFKNMDRIFRYGQYHAYSLHLYMIIPIMFTLFFRKTKHNSKIYYLGFVFIIITSFFYGIIEWSEFSKYYILYLSTIPIQLQRFHFLHPMTWYVLLAVSLLSIWKSWKYGRFIVYPILLFQFLYISTSHPFYYRKKSPMAEFFKSDKKPEKKQKDSEPLLSEEFLKEHKFIRSIEQNNKIPYQFKFESDAPGFKDFYSEKLFIEIADYIGKESKDYRVLCIGMHPAVAQFNGFYTLGGYFPNYPLSYKHEFRKIIEGELNKSQSLRIYFDQWGSRCYGFVSELGHRYIYAKNRGIAELDFNFDAMKKMGGQYLFSTSPIQTTLDRQLALRQIFKRPDSYYTIYLYELINE